MEKELKYRLDTKGKLHLSNGTVLYRIIALRSFGSVKKGTKGGYIKSYHNLSHSGNCWVGENAKVLSNACVADNAQVYGNAMVFDKARISEDAEVFGNAHIFENGRVCFRAKAYDNATVFGNAKVTGKSEVFGSAKIYGKATINCAAKVYGYAHVYGDAIVNNGKVYGNAQVCENSSIDGEDVIIYKDALVCGFAKIYGKVKISSLSDYMVIQNNFSSGRIITWTKPNNMWRTGCFYGTGKELIDKAYHDSIAKGDKYRKIVNFVEKFNEDSETNKKSGKTIKLT